MKSIEFNSKRKANCLRPVRFSLLCSKQPSEDFSLFDYLNLRIQMH